MLLKETIALLDAAEATDYGQIAAQVIITLLVMFIIGAFLGYLIELLFRRFVSAKKWVNPGFMKGPWLPLYGFGVVLMFSFTSLFSYWFADAGLPLYDPLGSLSDSPMGPTAYDLIPIISMTASLILLEFIAGLIFVKGFKVRLWDYTNMRGNILGIICPVFSLIWFAIALIYYYGANPFVSALFGRLYVYLFHADGSTSHFFLIFLLGTVYGLFFWDLVSSLGIFGKITAYAKKSGLLLRYEKFAEEQKERLHLTKKRFLALMEIGGKQDPSAKKVPLGKKAKQTRFYRGLEKIILIDPDAKKTTEDNYDASGRPIKIDEDSSK